MTVVCNMDQCKYNQAGKFCNCNILTVYDGVCGKLIDKQGRQRPPQEWVRIPGQENNNKEQEEGQRDVSAEQV